MLTNHAYSRKRFLLHSAIILGGGLLLPSFDLMKKKPKLAFSTLGCPDWDFKKITEFAVTHGYKGIEVRGIQRVMNLVESEVFNSPEHRKETMTRMNDKGQSFVGLGSSANLHTKETAERKKQLDEGRRFIDLAAQIDCPYVRVFPNNFPKEQEREETIDLITKGLLELAEHAKGSEVTVLMETHGDVVKTSDLLMVMRSAQHKHAGLVWDVANMWTITGEDPVEVYKQLKPFIRHVHVKDAKKSGDKLEYTLLTKGEVPIMKAIDAMAKDGYDGYYSFEWEKLWHPEIAEPEIALADFPLVMKKHFR